MNSSSQSSIPLTEQYKDYYENLKSKIKYNAGKLYCNEDDLPLDSPDIKYPEYRPGVKLKPFSSIPYIVCDIETTGLLVENNSIKAIGIRGNALADNFTESKSIKLYNNDEKQLLIDFSILLRNTNFKIIVFHNGLEFDIPFLVNKLYKHGLRYLFTRGDTVKITSGSINGQPIKYEEYFYPGAYIVDTLHHIAIWDRTYSKLSSYSLKIAPYEIGLIKEPRTDLSYEDLLECYRTNNIDLLYEYLEDDLISTELLYKFLLPSVYYQLLVVPDIDFQRLSRSSPALKAQKIYNNLCKPDSGVKPDETVRYEGALSKALSVGGFNNCFKLDVSSLYPSIMVNWGLCSCKDENLAFLGFMEYATKQRLEYKSQLKTLEKGSTAYNEIDAIQNAFKVLINGCGYGFLGTGFYQFNDFYTAALITAYGRKILKIMMSVMDKHNNLKIVNIDTDGIIVSIESIDESIDQKLFIKSLIDDIHSNLPEKIRVDLEFFNAAVYSPKAKNYVIFYSENEYTAKGIFKKRNIEKFVASFYLKYLQYYFYHSKAKADKYYCIYRELLVKEKHLMSDFVITRTVSKSETKIPALGIAKNGEKITYYQFSTERYHKRTGKFLRYEETPIRIDNLDNFQDILNSPIGEFNKDKSFSTRYYLDKLDKTYDEIILSLENS